jgi:hypothetical protein
VVSRTIDLLANRKLRHRELLLEFSMPNVERFVEAWVNVTNRSKTGMHRTWNLSGRLPTHVTFVAEMKPGDHARAA